VNLAQVYRALLNLYPADYRALFASEMIVIFQQAVEELPEKSGVRIRFAISELIGLLNGAYVEWVGKCAFVVYRPANLVHQLSFLADLTSSITYSCFRSNGSFSSRCLPDLRMMRPVGVSRESWYGRHAIALKDRV
jgi:hypothetical protein